MKQEKELTFSYALELHIACKFKEALEAYSALRAMRPGSLDVLNNLACVYDDLGMEDKALAVLNEVIDIAPDYFRAYQNRAYIYKKTKDFDSAILDYTRAIDLEPFESACYSNRGYCFGEKGRFEEALEDYTTAISLEPENPDKVKDRAFLYIKKNRYKAAVEDCLGAVAIKFPGHNALELVTLVRRGRLEKGEATLKKILLNGFYFGPIGDLQKKVILMPSLCDRVVLPLSKLHAGATITRHLKQYGNHYDLRFDSDFDIVIDRCISIWKEPRHLNILRYFFSILRDNAVSPRAVSVALYKDGNLVAGDLGVMIGKIFTSYTAFRSESSVGTVLLVLLGRLLLEKGFAYWDFGPSTARWDPYKLRLGAVKMNSKDYLHLFEKINGLTPRTRP